MQQSAGELANMIDTRYRKVTEAGVKTLVVEDQWMARIEAAVQGELKQVPQTLASRILELAERYSGPPPQIIDEVATLTARADNQRLSRISRGYDII
jgi:type I restriction enzyme M protein